LRRQVTGPRIQPSGIDAIVAAVADSHAARADVAILTADDKDLGALSQAGRHPVGSRSCTCEAATVPMQGHHA
jgi:hypothetical protein